jgi:hypothetical protein
LTTAALIERAPSAPALVRNDSGGRLVARYPVTGGGATAAMLSLSLAWVTVAPEAVVVAVAITFPLEPVSARAVSA